MVKENNLNKALWNTFKQSKDAKRYSCGGQLWRGLSYIYVDWPVKVTMIYFFKRYYTIMYAVWTHFYKMNQHN